MVLNHNVHHSSDGISLFCDKYCNCKSIYHRISGETRRYFLVRHHIYLEHRNFWNSELTPSIPPHQTCNKKFTHPWTCRDVWKGFILFLPQGPHYKTEDQLYMRIWGRKCILIAKAVKTFLKKKKKSYFSENVIHNKLMLFPARSSTSQQVAWK